MQNRVSGGLASAKFSEQSGDIVARLERLPFSPFHFRAAAILAVGTFFDAFDSICIGVALAVIFRSLHIGFFNAGLLLSSGFVGQFFGAWAFGFLSERSGRKVAFIVALGLFGLLSVVVAFAWNIESLVVLRVVQGFGLGGEVPVAAALFNELLRADKRGQVVTIYQTIFQWGALLTPLIGLACFGLFGPDLGWRVLFLFGGIPVLVAIYAWRALPESPRWLANHGRYQEADAIVRAIEAQRFKERLAPPRAQPPQSAAATSVGELFAGIYLRRTIMLWLLWATCFFVAYGFSIWLPTLYVSIGHLPVTWALWLSVMTWAVNIVTMYAMALVLDTIGRKPFLVAGFLVIAVGGFFGAVAVTEFHATGWSILFTVNIFLSIGTSLTTVLAVAYTAELYPTRMRGLGVSSASSMNRLASIAAPSVVGALLAAQLGIEIVFALFGLVGLIGAFVIAAMGIETKRRSLEELSP
ncbi:MAG TPA: MFS transporter [Stellaceae bacterium]|nr:MFS transporter [Stellaceae bacterium]